jgi:hypothetical protein
MGSCPKEKDEEDLKDQADKIKTGKLTTQRMASELMQTKNLEVINWAYAVAQEANKAACTGQGKQHRLEFTLDGSEVESIRSANRCWGLVQCAT